MKYRLFNASFSQAKKLVDEPILATFKTWQDNQDKHEAGLLSTLFFLILMFMIGSIFPFGSSILLASSELNLMKSNGVNLMPMWLYVVLFLIILFIILGTNFFVKEKKLEFYQGQWFFLNYGIVVLIEMNLFFGTLFTSGKQLLIPLLVVSINLLISIVILIFTRNKLLQLMYGISNAKKLGGKLKNLFFKYWWVLIIVYILIQLFSDMLGTLSLLFTWIGLNLIISIFLWSIPFVATVQGYYKIKYFDKDSESVD